MTDKTHYRKVFKSDHLGRADLEDYIESGHNLIFTIKNVKQEYGAKVAGRKIDANIAYFAEPNVKPLVLNAGNSKIVSDLAGSQFVQDWNNIKVQLYIDPTAKLKGEVVGGVRVSPNAVQQQKKQLTPDNKTKWEQAKAAYIRDGNFNKVLERMDVSEKHLEQMMLEVNNA
jgi:hypothetical protein